MKTLFEGKVVIVTGASSGIGRETALAFAEAGANVVMAARREGTLRKVCDEHPALRDRLLPVPADITRDDDVERLVRTTLDRFGRIDILVNNAGVGLRALAAQAREEDARQLMEVNLYGASRCIKAVLPQMKCQQPLADGLRGQIVNVGSVLSVIATPRNSIYCASKFALRALSDSLRMELHGTGVEVISVYPGYTDTSFFDNMVRYDGSARLSPFRGQHPRRVARAIVSACRHRKREIALTASGILGVWTKRFAPRLLDVALGRSV